MLGGKNRKNYTDSDQLQSSFLFYNEDKKLVRVTVEQYLDPTVLGYQYQQLEILWLNARPTPRRAPWSKRRWRKVEPSTKVLPVVLTKIVSFKVARERKHQSKEEKEKEEEEDEMLVLEDIQVEGYDAVKFDVYVNDDEESLPSGPEHMEFAGSFANLHHSREMMVRKTTMSFRVGITDILDDLQADDDESVVITLVPRYGGGDVTVGVAKIVIGLKTSPKGKTETV